ncbi:hypothetical protein QJQ45_006362 [Haematococcus lacustris]|nr:hypothetical protein QJQ45_006362 [Haematococcus lacustris]
MSCPDASTPTNAIAVLYAVHGQVRMDRDVAGPLPAPGPAAEPVSLTAAARVKAFGNGVDPLPSILWDRYPLKSKVPDNGQKAGTDTRCFEVLYKAIAQDLGLDLKAGAGVDILVALALEEPRKDPATDADLAHGDLQLLCVAKPNTEKKQWRFNTVHMKKKVRDWVKSVGKQLTGRYKAMPKPGGPHLLVLEVWPLPKAAAQAGCATSGGPGFRTGQKRKAAEAQLGQRLEAGQAVAAAAIKKRLTVEPSVAAGVSQPGGAAAAAAGLGTAEEGGPGPSQPAAGMGGAPDGDDPEVPQPAAAPAHAGDYLPHRGFGVGPQGQVQQGPGQGEGPGQVTNQLQLEGTGKGLLPYPHPVDEASPMPLELTKAVATLALVFSPDEGVLVVSVQPGGPADLAGVQPTRRELSGRLLLDDIITGINGRTVRTQKNLFAAHDNSQVGDTAKVVVRSASGCSRTPVTITCDNETAITLIKHPIASVRSKHIDVLHNFVRERAARGELVFKHLATGSNVADAMTKDLPGVNFKFCKAVMGMMKL